MNTKNFFFIGCLSVSALLSACNGNNKSGDNADSTAVTDSPMASNTDASNVSNGEVCFLRTEGAGNVDSTKIHLVLNGDAVSGELNWLPKEKDARKGLLEGVKQGDVIKAIWTFKQEGTEDTMAVQFEFKGDQLSQKPYVVNPKTGRQQTDSTAAYSVKYSKVDCK